MTRIAPGVYLLSSSRKKADYVGRSDVDVGSRIKQSATMGDYTHFWFEYATSPRDAYRKKCKYYHQYDPDDNINHPAVPPFTDYRCPIEWCDWS